MQSVYFILSIIGLVLPYSKFISFIAANGLDLQLFWTQLFANQISSFFALDLLISVVVFWIFVFREGTKLQMKFLWLYIVLDLLIGLSFALPLFLFVRSRKIDKAQSSHLATQIMGEAK
ncbi:MAG: DUF2834 domain-containing protein [Pleurocapsa sp. MO_192.B19]|nr:DUF2834 domain-containing protein [Pleurocapsa sp. MO_192.B19]